jgi:hypothetical protein
MKIESLTATTRVLLFLIAAGACALAQERTPVHFSGVINDYSPSTVKGGPWEMHGQWSLNLREESGTADFSADLTMSDYVVSGGVVDTAQAGQNPHTHHIRLTDATITWDMTGCPTFSPATKTGFQVNGKVSLLTGNGSNAPFEPTPPVTTLQVCITGGEEIPYSVQNSNVTLVFVGPATSHFGPQAIHGVVRNASAASIGKN